MVQVRLLLQGGHRANVELDEEDPVLAELITCLTHSPIASESSLCKLFSLTCRQRNRSVIFTDRALVAMTSSQPIELEQRLSAAAANSGSSGEFQTPAMVIDEFLPPEDNERILSFIISKSHAFLPARTYSDLAEWRSGKFLEDIPELRDWMMMQVLPLLPALSSQFGLSYRAVEKFECQLTSYCDGDYYKPHVDLVSSADAATANTSQRLISYTYYLHSTPKKFEGGALQFLKPTGADQNERTISTIEPKNNRIVFFPSGALHEVAPVSMQDGGLPSSRLSVNGWIRCRE